VTWPYAAYASRYRVKWAPAPYDTWPGPDRYMDPTSGGWIPQTARRSTWTVPTNAATDTTMTALPYAGAIFTRVETSNVYRPGSLRLSPWRFAFPAVPTPAAGNPVRFGTYNVMLGGTLEDSSWSSRYPVIAKNILSHGLNIVALQEIFADSRSRNGAQDVADWLTKTSGHRWGVEGDGAEGRILFDTTRFAVTGTGLLNDEAGAQITNMHSGGKLLTPWARFRPLTGGWTRPLVVVSAHFVPSGATTGSYNHQNNLDTGHNAQQVLAALHTLQSRLNDASDPVIIAGDFSANNTQTGDTSPARPTFVRAGYYDAMAAVTKLGVAYGTVNRRAVQSASSSGVAARADAIMLKGIVGTKLYDNVYNWRDGRTLPPSDHNLVFTDLQIPN
jgi:endonuclease/exonuclease/phosphatase family metal-dependent hydrolase